MKKVCFAGDLSFAEKSVGAMMKDKLTELLDEFPEEEFDFLFFKCCKLISKQGLYVIQDLKGAYPKRKLTVINIMDPLRVSSDQIDQKKQEKQDGFLPGSVDRFEFAPLINGRAETDDRRFIVHQRKISRWLWSQCDYMFAYYYDGLLGPVKNMIKGAEKNRNLTVIHIYEPETEKVIERELQALTGDDVEMIEAARNGEGYKRYAKKRNVSYQRARQCTMKVVSRVERQVKNELWEQKKCYSDWDFIRMEREMYKYEYVHN